MDVETALRATPGLSQRHGSGRRERATTSFRLEMLCFWFLLCGSLFHFVHLFVDGALCLWGLNPVFNQTWQ